MCSPKLLAFVTVGCMCDCVMLHLWLCVWLCVLLRGFMCDSVCSMRACLVPEHVSCVRLHVAPWCGLVVPLCVLGRGLL
jgi:hypothetical protein